MKKKQEPLVPKVTVEQFINKVDAAAQLMTEFNNEVGRAALVSCGISSIEEKRTLFFLAAQDLTPAEESLIPAEYLGLSTAILFRNDMTP